MINHGTDTIRVSMLDGLQNLLPYGVNSSLQNGTSNLVDAYKKSELEKSVGLGIYSLSAIIVDKAEPSEALKANIVWSLGLDNPTHLISSIQLNQFRRGKSLEEEIDIRAEKGAYFVNKEISLEPNEEKKWMIIAEVNQNHAAIAKISEAIKTDPFLTEKINEDIAAGTKHLIELNAAADGLQRTFDHFRDTRHFANTLFNICLLYTSDAADE